MAKDEQKEIDRLIKMTPELPEGFEKWCERKMKRPLIYYKRKGHSAEFTCGACGKPYYAKTADTPEFGTMEIETPRRNYPARCPLCGNQSFYEWKRITYGEFESRRFYLYQLSEDKTLIVRCFDYWRTSKQGRAMSDCIKEIGRFFMEYGQVSKLINVFTYRQDDYCWELRKKQGWSTIEIRQGETYPGWEETIKESTLKYCPLETLKWYTKRFYGLDKPDVSRIDALMTYANNPAVEIYIKSGMAKLTKRLCMTRGVYGAINRRQKTQKGQLRLKKKENINKLIKAAGDPDLLEILQYEEKKGLSWKPEWENKLLELWNRENAKRIEHMLSYMTMQQLINRLDKYGKQLKFSGWRGKLEQTIIKYDDYLQMREELGYDMTNEVFIYPRDLQEKHDEMVKERNAREDELTIKRKEKEYPDIAARYEKLCRKYQAEAEGYIIRPAKSAGEIITEGRKLHHCVGGDRYLGSHNKGRSYILFLRKKERQDEPYITIEIKGERIVQWYGAHDKKPQQEFFDKFLKEYEEQLKKQK